MRYYRYFMDRDHLKFNFYLVRIGKHAIIILVIKCCGTNDITVFALCGNILNIIPQR